MAKAKNTKIDFTINGTQHEGNIIEKLEDGRLDVLSDKGVRYIIDSPETLKKNEKAYVERAKLRTKQAEEKQKQREKVAKERDKQREKDRKEKAARRAKAAKERKEAEEAAVKKAEDQRKKVDSDNKKITENLRKEAEKKAAAEKAPEVVDDGEDL